MIEITLEKIAPVFLDEYTDLRRISIVPMGNRVDNFDAKYDANSLFYECFFVKEAEVMLISAPFQNLGTMVVEAEFIALPSGLKITPRFTHHYNVTETFLSVPKGTRELSFKAKEFTINMPIRDNQRSLFKGLRTLMTMLKDTPLIWIKDWAQFHCEIHGVEALLIYDNGSTQWKQSELVETLSTIPSLKKLVIVSWELPYGATGFYHNTLSWLGFYSQYGVFEHARYFYLNDAKSVMNADIDELTVSRTGRSVLEAVENSFSGLIIYYGRWVVGTSQTHSIKTIRHKEYSTVLKKQLGFKKNILPYDKAGCPSKWAIVPSKIPKRAQWAVHKINNYAFSYLKTSEFSFRHFREVNNSNMYNRSKIEQYSAIRHEKDQLLIRHFEKVKWV